MYQQLKTHFEQIGHLEGACSRLHWDGATMMPIGGGEAHAAQIAELTVIIHQRMVDPKVSEWLAMIDRRTLDEWDLANLREIEREFIHASAVPEALVKAHSEAGSRCEMIWRDARADNDFARLRPALEEVLTLTRDVAVAKSERLNTSPYNALLDQYEPGVTVEHIDQLFDQLFESLPGVIEQALEHQAQQDIDSPLIDLQGPFDVDTQRELGLHVMNILGFDFNHGRLDVSLHPFCGGTPSDVRITTRYNHDEFIQSLMGIIHETGHALYEQGLPSSWRQQLVGRARGMSVHESQSLLMEMQVGRSQAFIEYITPIIHRLFYKDQRETKPSADSLYRHYTRVERGLIRVHADEVTYPAHVMLRYQLEKAMLSGDLEIKDLPEAWNEGMMSLLGVAPPNDREGCMQDIHWMDGAFGYFPTYTLGAMTAAQLFESLRLDNPNLDEDLRVGTFKPLVEWLRSSVHSKASLLSTDDLLTYSTGRPLEVQPFLDHLSARYLK